MAELLSEPESSSSESEFPLPWSDVEKGKRKEDKELENDATKNNVKLWLWRGLFTIQILKFKFRQ